MGCFTLDMLFASPVQAFRYLRRHCPDLTQKTFVPGDRPKYGTKLHGSGEGSAALTDGLRGASSVSLYSAPSFTR